MPSSLFGLSLKIHGTAPQRTPYLLLHTVSD